GNDKLGTQLGGEQELIGISDKQSLSSGSKISAPTISHRNPISNKNKNGSKADRWGEMPEFLKDIELPNEQFENSELNDSAFEPNQNHSESQSDFLTSRPDQIETNSDNVKPEHNNAWEVNPAKRTPVNAKPVRSNSTQIRIHTVRSGETLSEISIRYLGTGRKYQEIFKLNRDQLRSPNDIREGMKLRIPVYQSPETTPQSANRQSSVGASGNSGKRTVGQMVSQPVLKSGSSTVQFEGLIESLSNSKDPKSLNRQDHKKTIEQLEKTLGSSKLLNGKKETKPLPENYRKFIPIPRSPLTPQEYSQNKKTISGQSLSQQQPENLEQIVEDLFDGNPGEAKQSKSRAQAKTYTIKSGDSLESIAVRLYGKRSAAFKIYQKNRDTLKNANYSRPGMVLQLP
ncbi:MAG: LysM peptidoglycan-binding domain-containing protein, partial [Gimesia sp.]|nr:LysM peptidoglycan-binding domain-containing protein [Gimesia sp.]